MNETTAATDRIRRLLEMDKKDLPPDGRPRFNRLIFEKSPYLLQHAENPVDWRPWGDEAFAAARAAGKPVFLSIGYATCHWCHVMEKESFENPDVAEVINRLFIPVKVDREERPDVDEQYMTAAQLMNGSGGWPLNVIATPDRRPVFAATYLPVEPRYGMPGIVRFLEGIGKIWREQRDDLERHGVRVAEELARIVAAPQEGAPEDGFLDAAYRHLRAIHDAERGGFGKAPKFPMPHFLRFLFLYAERRGDALAAEMAERTLTAMRLGGICDQIGFGFHRYSVDREWLVPHFEKMLYDQALLAMAYLDAFRFSGRPDFLRWAREIFAYVLEEGTAPAGGFASGLDADSEGEEGRFYVWRQDEIVSLLGAKEGELCCRLFGVSAGGNFEGANILHLRGTTAEFAVREGLDGDSFAAAAERWRETLLAARTGRVRPLRDEKVLAGWNGLMIAALAEGYGVTGDGKYLRAATEAADFLARSLTRSDGRLLRSHLGSGGDVPAFLEDYAFLSWGLLELHQATLEERFLERALALAREMLRLFHGGGPLWDSGDDAGEALLRTRTASDGVIPSGNSAAALTLLRLGRIAGDDELSRSGEGIVRAFSGEAGARPANHLHLLLAVDFLVAAGTEVTIIGGGYRERQPFLRELRRRFIPALTIRAEPGAGGEVAARVCARGACHPAVTGPEALGELLDSLRRSGV